MRSMDASKVQEKGKGQDALGFNNQTKEDDLGQKLKLLEHNNCWRAPDLIVGETKKYGGCLERSSYQNQNVAAIVKMDPYHIRQEYEEGKQHAITHQIEALSPLRRALYCLLYLGVRTLDLEL
ncbi:hypothetical protein ACH5RR_021651 [Cinchona calisaya]|uniref:Uncharacterized protein n=1 Tax=Cinchona calisaya TaxID=153742 RepID=A0ABD2ZLR0_9GENT